MEQKQKQQQQIIIFQGFHFTKNLFTLKIFSSLICHVCFSVCNTFQIHNLMSNRLFENVTSKIINIDELYYQKCFYFTTITNEVINTGEKSYVNINL